MIAYWLMFWILLPISTIGKLITYWIILEPNFKEFQCIIELVGVVQTRLVVAKCNADVLIPLLSKAFEAMNPRTSSTSVKEVEEVEVEQFCLFETYTTLKEAIEGKFSQELSLFCWLVIDKIDLEDGLFSRWKANEGLFLCVKMAEILINLRHICLSFDYFDPLIVIYKKWPINACTWCK